MRAYRRLGFVIVIPTLCLAVGCTSGPKEPTLDAVRTAAEKYRDVTVAKREGYTTDNKCTTAEMLGFPAEMGAMGLHYVRRDLLGLPPKPAPPGSGRVHGTGTYTDFTKPAMLVYEPQQDGSLKLVAVENLVFASAWQAAGKKGSPTFHGQPFILLTDKPQTKVDEAHGWEPHYELHVWLDENPNGMFAEFSPQVSCKYHRPPSTQAAAMTH